MANEYLRLTSLEDNNVISLVAVGTPNAVSMQYRTDLNEEFQMYTIGTELTLFNGSWIEFRNTSGSLSKDAYANYYKFTSTKKFNVSGKIGSLLYYTQDPIVSGVQRAFARLFNGCTNLIDASELEINMSKVATSLCESMFAGCTSLVTAPSLPKLSGTSATSTFASMFSGCTSLLEAPELPSTQVWTSCYAYMFSGCTSLVKAPSILPATTLPNNCYEHMFDGCSSLTEAPEIMGTSLYDYCCRYMFWNCTSLKEAPYLPAKVIKSYCYDYMFSGCTSLVKIPDLDFDEVRNNSCRNMFSGCISLTDVPFIKYTDKGYYTTYFKSMFDGCTNLKSMTYGSHMIESQDNWLNGVSATGTFYYTDPDLDLRYIPRTQNGIPAGWSIVYKKQGPSLVFSINGKPVASLSINGKQVAKLG